MTGSHPQPCIVTFIGPVGVGKSTQIRLFQKYLKSKNILVIRTFIKSNHVLTYFLSSLLKTLGASEKVSYPNGFSRVYPKRTIVRKIFPLWCFLDAVSVATKFLFTVSIPFRLGFTVLIEEGLPMSLYTYTIAFPTFFQTEPTTLLVLPNLLGWLTNKAHVNIVLDASEEELDQRRRGRNYRQSELAEYVSLQKKWIKHLNLEGTVFIDTSNASHLSVHEKIIAAVEKCVFPR
jgi:hypothetical protein